jgi:hypothetical protein
MGNVELLDQIALQEHADCGTTRIFVWQVDVDKRKTVTLQTRQNCNITNTTKL